MLLDGRGSSLGYARAMECLLDAAGIKNQLIYKADDRSVAWNAARLDGVWTHIDAYADDAARTPRKHFALCDDEMAADHSWSRSSAPVCPAHHF